MSCRFLDLGLESGKCQLWDEGIEYPGCDDKGNCICCDDPDPTQLCEDYEEC